MNELAAWVAGYRVLAGYPSAASVADAAALAVREGLGFTPEQVWEAVKGCPIFNGTKTIVG